MVAFEIVIVGRRAVVDLWVRIWVIVVQIALEGSALDRILVFGLLKTALQLQV